MVVFLSYNLTKPNNLTGQYFTCFISGEIASHSSEVGSLPIRLICLWLYLSQHTGNCQINIFIYSLSQKQIPLRGPDISHFSHKRLRIFNRFFTHLLHIPIYARLQIFIQLSPILAKLCHIKRDYPVHIICSRCSPSVETHALTRLRKWLIALLVVVCGK